MPKFSNYCFGRNDRHFWVFLFCFVTRASVWIEVFLTACLSSHVFHHQVTNYVENGRGSGSKKQATHLAACPFPKLGWPHFLLLLVSLCSFFLCGPSSLILFFFFSFFLESYSLAKEPGFSHRTWYWRLSHCFLLQGTREGGGWWWSWGGGWLPGCQYKAYVSVRKSRGDWSDDFESVCVPENEYS